LRAAPPPSRYTRSLHDALPISGAGGRQPTIEAGVNSRRTASVWAPSAGTAPQVGEAPSTIAPGASMRTGPEGVSVSTNRCCGWRSEEHTSELQSRENLVCRLLL